MIHEFWEVMGAFGISVAGVGLALVYARRAGLLDIPNARSSHSAPTPRGGGIGLVSAVLVLTAYELARFDHRSWSLLLLLLGVVSLLTIVGWMDDRGSMRIGLRLSVHFACGVAVALLVNEIAPLRGALNVAWLAWWVFWTIASINIVNFMDGLDGMVAAQGVVYGIFLFALTPASTSPSRFGLILAAACLGFLLWNWAPAKMFMGDVGSGPLGLFFVIGGALALEDASPTLVFLPLFPLFLDALLTLLTRFRRGERLTDAHRSHLYQRLANAGWGHAQVTTIYAVAASVGAIVALAVKNDSAPRIGIALIIYVLVVSIGWMLLHARSRESTTGSLRVKS